jgi:hypothetical protein
VIRGLASAATILAIAAATPMMAQAQSTDRVRVSVNAGAQLATRRLRESIELTKFVESAPLQAEVPNGAVPSFDVGGSVRLFRNLGAMVSFSYLSGTDAASVTAQIPHPFLFDRPRTIAGDAPGVQRTERAIHVDGVYVVVMRRFDVSLFGGATFLHVDEDFVSDVSFAQVYPYDTASFASATLSHGSGQHAGYNTGADLTWTFGRGWGAGGMVRFTRARVPFSFDNVAIPATAAGGVQVYGGLRMMF